MADEKTVQQALENALKSSKENSAVLDEQIKKQEQIRQILEKQGIAQKVLAEYTREIADLAERKDFLKQKEKIKETEQAITDALREQADLAKKITDKEGQLDKARGRRKKAIQDEIDELKKSAKDQVARAEDFHKTLKEQTSELIKQTAEKEAQAKLDKLAKKDAEFIFDLATKALTGDVRGVFNAIKTNAAESIKQKGQQVIAEKLKQEAMKKGATTTVASTTATTGLTAALARLTPAIASAVSGLTVYTGGLALLVIAVLAVIAAMAVLIYRGIKLATALMDAENAFMLTTGASRDFAAGVTDAAVSARTFGLQIEEVTASAGALFSGFTDFTLQNQQTVKSLAMTGAALEKLGMTNQNFAQSIQISTKAMGMSADGAGQMLLNLEKFSRSAGIPFSELSANFAQNGDMLAKMGNQGEQAFKDLSMISKRTGLDMQRLLAITNQFDTFEGAAAQAGKLNAALGGNFVNAMELMMETDPAGRFNMIRDSLLSAGLAFDDMTYYQKNFYKEALGLSDVSELALIMSGNANLMAGSTANTAQSFVEAAERAQQLASFQEKLNILFANFSIALDPLVDLLILFSEALVKAQQLSGALQDAMFHRTASPTLFNGIKLMAAEFDALSNNINSTERSMSGLSNSMEANRLSPNVSIPKMAQAMATPTTAVNQSSTTRSSTQTIAQPINISIGGDQLKQIVLDIVADHGKEALGAIIKNSNL